ncbi:MAG: ATP-binding protein [Spirochaetales bacterium]|nr:ATP-binding protein [Spirochaetales bacterium]
MSKKKQATTNSNSGKLKIGNNWNAITIIALSQNNPLKAIAEFIENSIDARAKTITIIRGKKKGETYLKIIDDGEGIDDFKYVATHIGDSIKRKLKKHGATGIQGEFGIGLLSFWTVGEEINITSTGKSGEAKRIKLVKNNPGFQIKDVNSLFSPTGTELVISSILPGVKQLSGEKIQNYLASELRDRISKTGVKIKILDRTSRKEFLVEPRKFKGRLLHDIPEIKNPLGEIYCELYLNEPLQENQIGLYKLGTRVLPSIKTVEHFNCFPWDSPYLEGIIDASFIQLTPGTRDGFIYDHAYESFIISLEPLKDFLITIINEQKKAEEDKASKNILKKITKALQEAFHHLPQEEYSWLHIKPGKKLEVIRSNKLISDDDRKDTETDPVYLATEIDRISDFDQKEFFEIPGSLYSAIISPSSVVIGVGDKKKLKIIARDKSKRQLDSGYSVKWYVEEGEGVIDNPEKEFVQFTATDEPGIISVGAIVTQDDRECLAECIITVTKELINKDKSTGSSNGISKKGLPGYTFQKAPGELWRSRFDTATSLIIINNGHADFIYASKSKTRKLRYVAKLFTKELVLSNFPEASRGDLLERMIELQMYMEENLRS